MITIRALKDGRCPEIGCGHLPPNNPPVPSSHNCFGSRVAILNGHTMRGVVDYLARERATGRRDGPV